MFLNDTPTDSPEVSYQICSPHYIDCSGSLGTATECEPDDWLSSLEGHGFPSAPIMPRVALRFLQSSLQVVKQPEREADLQDSISCFSSN